MAGTRPAMTARDRYFDKQEGQSLRRHDRLYGGHPRLSTGRYARIKKSWVAGTSPAMTVGGNGSFQ